MLFMVIIILVRPISSYSEISVFESSVALLAGVFMADNYYMEYMNDRIFHLLSFPIQEKMYFIAQTNSYQSSIFNRLDSCILLGVCINVSSDKLFWCINSRSIYSVRLCLCGQYVFYGDTLFYSYKFTAKYRNRYWLRVSFMVVFNIINHSHTAAIITAVQIIRRSCSRWFFNSLLA